MNGTRPTVDQLMAATFDRPRDPSSAEYKAGCRAVLAYRIDRQKIVNPFFPGSPEADAFASGTQEGHRVWREQQEVQRNATSRPVEYL